MSSRTGRAYLAKTTLEVMEVGRYVNPRGETVTIAAEMEACNAGSACFEPDILEQMRDAVLRKPVPFTQTEFQLENETTLEGARALAADSSTGRIGVLNFASAKNPGGGFLGGSQAQEESLARSSSLYASLNLFHNQYYETHRRLRSAFYSDRMIYSPA
ncbi:MAG: TIGR02452 family protein [Planctomycetaceae bacterium]|nr:TIGR02452 family protein [Planctomycetaceae bacterium]